MGVRPGSWELIARIVLVGAVAFLPAALAAAAWLRRRVPERRSAGELAAILGIYAGAVAMAPIAGPDPEGGLRGVAVVGGGLLVALGAGAATWWIATRARLAHPVSRTGATLAAVLPAAFAFLLAGVWLEARYFVQDWTGMRLTIGVLGISGLSVVLFALVARRVLPVAAPLAATLFAFAIVLVPSLAAAALAASRQDRLPPPAGPSVLLLTVDTLRADVLSAVSEEWAETPNLDRLLADSVVFEQARSPAPWTKPAVTSMLSGLSPLAHGTSGRESVIPEAIETLPQILASRGYRTGAVVRNPFLGSRFGFGRGFDRYLWVSGERIRTAVGGWILERLRRYRRGESTTTELSRAAIEWLRRPHDRPFFFWLHVFDPHIPYAPPPAHLPEPAASGRVDARFNQMRAVREGRFVPTLAERERIRELYRAEVEYVDAEIGRLLAALEEDSRYDDLLIVLSSDHGEEFWEHDGFEHGHTLYDELLRVPLAIKPPGGAGGRRITTPVATTSVTPTILDLAGLEDELRPEMARSLAELWERPDRLQGQAPHLATGLLYGAPRISLVLDGMKLIVEPKTGRQELFDLAADPGERAPLAAHEHPEVFARMRETLRSLQERAERVRDGLGIASETTTLAPETREALRSLGYIR